MNRFGLIAGMAIAVLLPSAAIADDQHVIAQPESLKWTAAPPVLPKGRKSRLYMAIRTKRNHSSSGSNSPPATRWQPTCTPTIMT